LDGINHILASRELLPRVRHQQILGKYTRYLANLIDYTEPLSKRAALQFIICTVLLFTVH
jgi:hypothetical protein